MLSAWMSLERSTFFAFMLVSWFAGMKAAKLHMSCSEREMHDRLRKLNNMLGGLVFLSIAVVVTNLALHWPVYDSNNAHLVILRNSCMIIPAFMLSFVAKPRLIRLLKRTTKQTELPIDVSRRRHSSHPDLVAPFLLTALGATAAAVSSLIPSYAFTWGDSGIATALIIVAGIVIWFNQHRSNEQASAETSYVQHSREERLRHRY